MSSEAFHLGCRALRVVDEVQGVAFAVWLLYATRDAPEPARFGLYTGDGAMDGEPAGEGRVPLVLISHGTGGTPWAYRDLAGFLARSGFVVALVEHAGNHRGDDSLAGTVANLENRPRHVARAIDAALADPLLGPRIARDRIAVIGHSMGGYTALAVAGGEPWATPHETKDGAARPLAVTHDPRVRALVLLAPAAPWFMPDGALAKVDLPILLRTAEHDPYTPAFNGALVERGVRDASRVEAKVVAGAGHFAFLSPFPPAARSPLLPASQDPPGFDREAYLEVLKGEVFTFLQRALAPAA